MTKPTRGFPRPLSEFTAASLGGALKSQGFASTEILTRWREIVGAEVAAHSEPMRINWPRPKSDVGEVEQAEPATLVLRVEGPAALEIQHLSAVILERVNRFFGWQAIGRLALRQAPLRRKVPKARPAPPDPALTARLAADMTEVHDSGLRDALARLGSAIKTK
ncbi:MAG: DciA family protein [Pseudolabrys sp.]